MLDRFLLFIFPMQIAVSDWHNKAKTLIKALTAAGHMVVERTVISDALLIDTDFPVGNYRNVMGFQRKHGAKIFLYSHGANAFLGWDGIWEPQTVDGYFCMAEGVKEVMGLYHTPYPYPIYNIGWHFCEMLPFQPVQTIKRVLFAPWHPHANGYLLPEIMDINTRIMAELAEKRGAWEITVRHLRSLAENGLPWYEGVKYVEARPNNTHDDIDEADLVISVGTYAHLALARGKPTLMYGQDIIPHEAYQPGHFEAVKSWENYRALMRYPFEWGEVTDLSVVTRDPVDAWRKKFIGEPFQPAAFVALLERLVGEKAYA